MARKDCHSISFGNKPSDCIVSDDHKRIASSVLINNRRSTNSWRAPLSAQSLVWQFLSETSCASSNNTTMLLFISVTFRRLGASSLGAGTKSSLKSSNILMLSASMLSGSKVGISVSSLASSAALSLLF